MLWHHNARVNSHQRWKQTRFRACFHLWCELTITMNVTEWQVSWNSCNTINKQWKYLNARYIAKMHINSVSLSTNRIINFFLRTKTQRVNHSVIINKRFSIVDHFILLSKKTIMKNSYLFTIQSINIEHWYTYSGCHNYSNTWCFSR